MHGKWVCMYIYCIYICKYVYLCASNPYIIIANGGVQEALVNEAFPSL